MMRTEASLIEAVYTILISMEKCCKYCQRSMCFLKIVLKMLILCQYRPTINFDLQFYLSFDIALC